MTSNLGSQVIQEHAGEKNYARMKSAVMEIVTQNFRPEFINPIDDIVVFHPLGTAVPSGWNTTMSSMGLMNSGRKFCVTISITADFMRA